LPFVIILAGVAPGAAVAWAGADAATGAAGDEKLVPPIVVAAGAALLRNDVVGAAAGVAGVAAFAPLNPKVFLEIFCG
jgi:hypothetical protein